MESNDVKKKRINKDKICWIPGHSSNDELEDLARAEINFEDPETVIRL